MMVYGRPRCEPWCWYIRTYNSLGDFGLLGKCWCAYSSTMVRIWVCGELNTMGKRWEHVQALIKKWRNIH